MEKKWTKKEHKAWIEGFECRNIDVVLAVREVKFKFKKSPYYNHAKEVLNELLKELKIKN